MKYSKFIVLLVIILNVVFASATFFVFTKTGSEPTTLITAWFGFTTVELWQLATIKKKDSTNGGA